MLIADLDAPPPKEMFIFDVLSAGTWVSEEE